MKIRCKKCDVVFPVDADYWERAKQNRATIYCPNGHGFLVAKSPADRDSMFDQVFGSDGMFDQIFGRKRK